MNNFLVRLLLVPVWIGMFILGAAMFVLAALMFPFFLLFGTITVTRTNDSIGFKAIRKNKK